MRKYSMKTILKIFSILFFLACITNTRAMEQAPSSQKTSEPMLILKKRKNDAVGIKQSYEEAEYAKLARKYENKLKKHPEIKNQFPRYQIAGNTSYFMTLEELKNHISIWLKHMRQQHQLITRAEFAKMNQSQWYPKTSNLTRIFGAEYLKNMLRDPSIRVPKYLIVVDNMQDIRIEIKWDFCFPIIKNINGELYAEHIIGTGVAGKKLIGYGYTDYSAPENILMDSHGIYYVVDTEYKSFYDGEPEMPVFKNYLDQFDINQSRIKGSTPYFCRFIRDKFAETNKLDLSKGVLELQFSIHN